MLFTSILYLHLFYSLSYQQESIESELMYILFPIHLPSALEQGLYFHLEYGALRKIVCA